MDTGTIQIALRIVTVLIFVGVFAALVLWIFRSPQRGPTAPPPRLRVRRVPPKE